MIIGQTYQLKEHPAVYPYYLTFVVPSMYHIIVFPEGERKDLLDLAREQTSYNRLKSCLVLGPQTAIYLNPDGTEVTRSFVPRGGYLCHNKLKPCRSLIEDEKTKERKEFLDKFISSIKQGGYILGDLSKGGKKPTPDDVRILRGAQPNGVPKYLFPCPTCGDWYGTCLDSIPGIGELVVEVSCLCDNDNRCAACGALLYERKLNSNYFDPRDRRVWHIPGFCGLNHVCKHPALNETRT